MNGEPLPRRGEIWWVLADKRRPAIIVQSDVREPRIHTFLVVPLTSRIHLASLPGNVRLLRRSTGLSKDSVANVYDVQKVNRADLVERVAVLPGSELDEIGDGLRLVLGL